MALVESLFIPIGSKMPEFELRDPHGKFVKSQDIKGEKGILVTFMCNHCPYAQAIWPRLIRLAQYAEKLGITTVAINPNIHPDYPEDSSEEMKRKIKDWGIPFPYLVDETQEIARAFKAQCTPDLYLFDREEKLVYHGRFDNNWQDETKVTKEDLREAIENLVKGEPISKEQFPSMGCSIKWL